MADHNESLSAEVERLHAALRSQLNWRELAVAQIAEQQAQIAAVRPILEGAYHYWQHTAAPFGLPIDWVFQAEQWLATHPASPT